MKERKIPLRMCIVCREQKDKRQMLRIVKGKDDIPFLDFSSKAPGRGAYVCDNPDCINKLVRKKYLDRLYGEQVDAGIYKSIEEAYFGRTKE